MIQEHKSFTFHCDRCGTTAEHDHYRDPPKGWVRFECSFVFAILNDRTLRNDMGRVDHHSTVHMCPSCKNDFIAFFKDIQVAMRELDKELEEKVDV